MGTRLLPRRTISSLIKQANAIYDQLHPAPLIIDATLAKEQLLKMFEPLPGEEPYAWAEEDEVFHKQFTELLEYKTEQFLEQYPNTKFV